MRDDQWSGDRMPRNRIMLITVPLVVTMAVGLIVGIRMVSDGNPTLKLTSQGGGAAHSTPVATATAARRAAIPGTAGSAATPSASPAVTASPAATPTVTAPG